MKTAKEIISENLKLQRDRLQWTQDVASEKTGVPKRTLARAENSKENTDVLTLEAIAKGYGIALFQLFIDVNEQPPKQDPTPAECLEILRKFIESK